MNNQSSNNGNNNNNKRNANGQMILLFLLITLVALFFMSMFSRWQRDMTTKEISYTEFLEMVEADKVEEVHVTSNSYRITPKKAENELVVVTYYTGIAGNDLELVSLLKEHNVEYYPYIPDDSATWVYNILSIVLPILLLWAVMGFIMRKMGNGMGMGVGKNTAKVYVEKKTGVTFKDVAGQDEAKESLQEVVDFLHNPQKYTDIGAKLPKGALLVGPPGTGKTLLAKAVAGEANVPFFSLAGSDFVEMFVGVGASRVRDLFKEAQKQAPCIIFIDEIDAIGKSRDTRYGGGNDEREQTLNQLLAEMDGFDTSKGLLILAATNRPEVLDKALLRPGRFDRRIIVEKPDLKGRVETLKVHSKDVLMDETVDLDAIALATSGAVGSDLANMINEAAINAVKHGRKYVNQSDLFESVEVVIAGKEKKDRILGKEEKRIVAYHEVGHALTTALQKNAEPVQKITIVPRTMGALGYVMQAPEEEKYLMSEEELKARLVTFMAGRAAEEIVFHSITTGASNDIEKATQIARAMVTQYGMSKKFGLISLESVENRYLDGRPVLNCGDNTAAEIDQEVQILLKESYETARKLLEENRDVLDKIAEYLFEHETITGKEFMRIFRELKGIPEPPEEEKTEENSSWGTKKQPVNLQGAVPPQNMPAQGTPGQTGPVPGQYPPAPDMPAGLGISGRNISEQGQGTPGQGASGQNLSGSGMQVPGQGASGRNWPAPGMKVPGQGASGQNLPGQSASGQNLSGHGVQAPGQGTSGQNLSGSGMPAPGQGASGQNLSGPGMQTPGQGISGRNWSAPGMQVPGQGTSDRNWFMQSQNVSGQGIPRQNMPGQGVSGQNMPGQSASGQNMPGQSASGQNMLAAGWNAPLQNQLASGQQPPVHKTTGQPVSGWNIPDQTAQNWKTVRTVPNQTLSDQAVQTKNIPDQAVQNQNAPAQDIPDQAVQNQNAPAQNIPDQTVQNQNALAQDMPGQAVQNQNMPPQNASGRSVLDQNMPASGWNMPDQNSPLPDSPLPEQSQQQMQNAPQRQQSDWERQLWNQNEQKEDDRK